MTGLKSIRNKLIGMTLGISIVVVISLILSSAFLSNDILKKLMGENVENLVESYAYMGDYWFENSKKDIDIYADKTVVKAMNWQGIKRYLEQAVYTKKDIYQYFFIADREGNFKTTHYDGAGTILHRDYYHGALSGKTVVSKPLISKVTGEYVYVIAAPITNWENEIVGVLGAVINIRSLYNLLNTYEDYDIVSNIYLQDKNDLVSISKQTVEPSMLGALSEKVKDAISNEVKSDEEPQQVVLVNKNLYYWKEIKNGSGLYVVAEVDTEHFRGPIVSASIKLAIIGIMGILIGAILSRKVARKMSKPIIHLKEVFHKASQGDLNIRAEVMTEDEIGEASRGFNSMMDRITYMTYKDDLTQLANMRYFNEKLQEKINHIDDHNEKISVVILGLDRFKYANDILGRKVGDKLLISIAKGLKNELEDNEILSRVGSDEFVLLLNVEDDDRLEVRLEAILECIKKDEVLEDYRLFVSGSIGVAQYLEDGSESLSLFEQANIAMHHAKDHGGDRYQFYTDQMNAKLNNQLVIESSMKSGLENDNFYLVYQPIMDSEEGRPIGVEALARWEHRELGFISPGVFIPMAEKNGFIVKLGEWILRKACEQNKTWQDAGNFPMYVSVNISAVQLQSKGFIDMVERILKDTQLDPRYLILEITEGILLDYTEGVEKVLRAIKELGIMIALDDFGTGYSSLSYLQKFPFDILKIDQSFIKDLVKNDNNNLLASTIIDIGKRLKLKVIAEGVETKEQLDYLRAEACYYIQGYYYSPPVRAKDVTGFFTEMEKNT